MRWVVVRSVLLILTVCAFSVGACQQADPPEAAPQTATARVDQPRAAASQTSGGLPVIEGAEAMDMKAALALRSAQRGSSADDCEQDDPMIGADPVFHIPETVNLSSDFPAKIELDGAPVPQPPPGVATVSFEPVSLAYLKSLAIVPERAQVVAQPFPAAEVALAADVVDVVEVTEISEVDAQTGDPLLVVEQTPLDTFVVPEGLPKNTRRVREGYWIGGRPQGSSEIEALYNAGVRVVISGVLVDDKVAKTIRKLGMRHLRVPFGQEFPQPDKLLGAVEGAKSSEVFIHCEHGSDRSGAMIAFFLVLKHGWRPDHALLAMTSPSKLDIDGQIAVLKESGLHITQEELDTYWGIYSGHKNGGIGGLKVRDKGYRRLINTTLNAMVAKGILLNEDAAKGDMTMAGRPEDTLQGP